jgi:hypothetical protein
MMYHRFTAAAGDVARPLQKDSGIAIPWRARSLGLGSLFALLVAA